MLHHLSQILFLAIAMRTAIVCLILILGLRLMGKRQLGQMNIYDLALIMLLANAVQNAMTEGKGDLGVGFISAGTLLFIGAAMTYIFVRLPKLEDRVVGSPTILINEGVLLKDHLRRERLAFDELMRALREHELFSVEQVKLAVLEPDGTMSIVPKDPSKAKPVSAASAGDAKPADPDSAPPDFGPVAP